MSKDYLDESELMDIFFNDAPEARLMINGESLRIVRVNDAFLELFSMKRAEVVGKLWKELDHPDNHEHYNQYIKELNTKDSMSFIIKHQVGKEFKDFKCVYQISALSGTIGYLGSVKRVKQPDVPSSFVSLVHSILNYNHEIKPETFESVLNETGMEFLGQYRFSKGQLTKQSLVGDVERLNALMGKYENTLIKRVSKDIPFEISREKYPSSQVLDILLDTELKSLYIYPVTFQKNLYGVLVAGGKHSNNWNTVRSLMQMLSHQISFNLFDILVEKQKEIDDQYDKLTGLRNRVSLELAIEELQKQGVEDEKYISLFAVSIDNLKSINEKIGVKYTDEVLRSFSQNLSKIIRRMGKVYRVAGQEFGILLSPHRNKDSSLKVADKLIDRLSNPTLLSNGEEVNINFNMGISIFPDEGQTVKSLRKNVDLALMDSRSQGINNYVVFNHAETGIEIKQKSEMEERLRLAIKDNQIQIFFQPKIKTATEQLVGFEALVRWVDSNLGVVEPGFFIPLAEETGLIHEIGKLVVIKACQQLKKWQTKYRMELSCSINLSAKQLTNPKLPQLLEKIINKTELHPKYLDFEITESMGLDNVPNLVERLHKIVEIGCTLSIDDFGTGHSSLDYVKKIPAKHIKIDQSFVSNIGLNPEDEAILDTTIDMAKRLKREIIAEGVESEQQREFLLARGVDYVQGFLFSKPLHENKVDQLLQELANLMSIN